MVEKLVDAFRFCVIHRRRPQTSLPEIENKPTSCIRVLRRSEWARWPR
jgi:hypothetical protein